MRKLDLLALTALVTVASACKSAGSDAAASSVKNNGTENVNPELSSTVELDLEMGRGRCTGSVVDLAMLAAKLPGAPAAAAGGDLFVLTAAHCVVRFTPQGQPPRMIVPIEETELPSEIEIPLGLGGGAAPMLPGVYSVLAARDVTVRLGVQVGGGNVVQPVVAKSVLVHPSWDPAQANVRGAQGQRLPAASDLAVIVLDRPQNLGVPALPLASALPQNADVVHFSGYGQTSAIDPTGSGVLREGTNSLAAVALGQGQVLATVGPLPAPTPQGQRPQAAAPGQLVCGAGDSGGPLAAMMPRQNVNAGDVVGVLHGGKAVPARGGAGQDYVCVFASIAEASNTRFLAGALQGAAQLPAGVEPVKPNGDETASISE